MIGEFNFMCSNDVKKTLFTVYGQIFITMQLDNCMFLTTIYCEWFKD